MPENATQHLEVKKNVRDTLLTYISYHHISCNMTTVGHRPPPYISNYYGNGITRTYCGLALCRMTNTRAKFNVAKLRAYYTTY